MAHESIWAIPITVVTINENRIHSLPYRGLLVIANPLGLVKFDQSLVHVVVVRWLVKWSAWGKK